jgi:hypothetical protein
MPDVRDPVSLRAQIRAEVKHIEKYQEVDASRVFALLRDVLSLLEASPGGAETKDSKLRQAVQEYLEWGAMTGSDRDWFERKFRDALASPPAQTTPERHDKEQ